MLILAGELDSIDGGWILTYMTDKQDIFSEAKVYAMDVNHDGKILEEDYNIIMKKSSSSPTSVIDQNSKVIVRDTSITYMSDKEIINRLGITSEEIIEKESEKLGTYYAITLNQEYTYAELVVAIAKKISKSEVWYYSNIENYDEIAGTSTANIESGVYIDIYIPYSVNGNEVFGSREIMLQVN